MIKKCVCALLALVCALPLAGCWNYRGLDEMTIVVGIAVDKDDESGEYEISFEFVDLAKSTKDEGPKSKVIKSNGKTIFDAVRNAKKQVANKLYMGHAQLIIIGEKVALDEDIRAILDFFMRDGEYRETIHVSVSQEDSAADILDAEATDLTIVSMELVKILETDNKVTSSTAHRGLYEAYEIIKTDGTELVLPAIRLIKEGNESTCEVNGIAVFKEEKLVGYLSAEESKYFLFAYDDVEGGVITFPSSGEGEDDTTLEITNSKTSRSVVNKDGKPSVSLKVEMEVFLNEYAKPDSKFTTDEIAKLEEIAAKKTGEGISALIKKVQSEYGSDIFCFGGLVNKSDYDMWEQVKDDWESQFKQLEVQVEVKVNILNTAYLISK